MFLVAQAVPGGRAFGPPAVIALALCTGGCAPARLESQAALPASASLPPIPPPSVKPAEKPLFSQTGAASWYRPKLQRRTASGEAFDAGALTAAHRSLPFGTVIRVTCLKTGKMVKVRVNDRGPFTRGRVLDVSAAAAEVLGMTQDGESSVRIEEFASDQT
jgi:rare lipoprotein A